MDANSAITDLTFTGGTLDGSFSLDINGLFTWSGGSLAGGGPLNVNAGAALSGTNVINVAKTVILAGATSWTGNIPGANGAKSDTMVAFKTSAGGAVLIECEA